MSYVRERLTSREAARLMVRGRDARANMLVLLCYGAGLTLEAAVKLRASKVGELEGWQQGQFRDMAVGIANQPGRLYAVETHATCGGMLTVEEEQALRILNLAAERAGLVGRIGKHTLTRSYAYAQISQNGQSVESVARHLGLTAANLEKFMKGGRMHYEQR